MATVKKKPQPKPTRNSIQITKNSRLTNDSKPGTFEYKVPDNAYIEIDAYVYRHLGIGGSGVLRVYLPMPNDQIDLFTSNSKDAAVLYNKATECYRLPQGTTLRVVATKNCSLQVAFTEFRTIR